jgi:hypothetical protein
MSNINFQTQIKNFKFQISIFEFKCHFLKFKYTCKSPHNMSRGVTNLVIIMTNGTY